MKFDKYRVGYRVGHETGVSIEQGYESIEQGYESIEQGKNYSTGALLQNQKYRAGYSKYRAGYSKYRAGYSKYRAGQMCSNALLYTLLYTCIP